MYLLIGAIFEAKFLMNVESLINCELIYKFWTISSLIGLYASSMAKYDLYTDIVFTVQGFQCKDIISSNLTIQKFNPNLIEKFLKYYTLSQAMTLFIFLNISMTIW